MSQISRGLLPEGFQSPNGHIFSPTIAQNIKIVVIGSYSKIAVARTVPLVCHFLNFKAPIPQKKAQGALISLIAGITFNPNSHNLSLCPLKKL
jgi:hypothetical protein